MYDLKKLIRTANGGVLYYILNKFGMKTSKCESQEELDFIVIASLLSNFNKTMMRITIDTRSKEYMDFQKRYRPSEIIKEYSLVSKDQVIFLTRKEDNLAVAFCENVKGRAIKKNKITWFANPKPVPGVTPMKYVGDLFQVYHTNGNLKLQKNGRIPLDKFRELGVKKGFITTDSQLKFCYLALMLCNKKKSLLINSRGIMRKRRQTVVFKIKRNKTFKDVVSQVPNIENYIKENNIVFSKLNKNVSIINKDFKSLFIMNFNEKLNAFTYKESKGRLRLNMAVSSAIKAQKQAEEEKIIRAKTLESIKAKRKIKLLEDRIRQLRKAV